MLWTRGIFFNVPAQTHNEIINGAGIGVFSQSPNLFEYGFTRNDSAAIANQVAKQFSFHDRQPRNRPFCSELEIYEINGAAAKRELVQFFLIIPSV